MKVAILGSRGVPNKYGGFERLAERLGLGLKEKGHDIDIFCPHYRNHGESYWNNIKLIFIKNPEHQLGAAGNFLFDFLSICKSLSKRYDIVYMLGYTSSSPFLWLLRLKAGSAMVINMDGLEWKRTKWNKYAKLYLRFAEMLAIRQAKYIIADSIAIQDYLKRKYGRTAVFIPYGADIFSSYNESILREYDLKSKKYFMLIARVEPENNIETIIKGFLNTNFSQEYPLVIVGNYQVPFGRYLQKKYPSKNIRFLGGIYDQEKLCNLRYFCLLYMHGHSVGGTNPALLEAMGCGALVAAHDNIFNREVLEDAGLYFTHHEDVSRLMASVEKSPNHFDQFKQKAIRRIQEMYDWPDIIEHYKSLFNNINNNKV